MRDASFIQSIEAAKCRIIEGGLAEPADVVGCTDDAVNEIESEVGVSLPPAYRLFLASMGGGAGKFMQGSNWTCGSLVRLQEAAWDLLREQRKERFLTAEAFVFIMHQGYQFLFFHSDGGDDPPVWRYIEGDAEPQQVAESFTAWLAMAVEDDVEALAEFVARPFHCGIVLCTMPRRSASEILVHPTPDVRGQMAPRRIERR